MCLLKQPSFFQDGETHPLEVRWEKHPSAYFYYNFLKRVLKWRVHSHLSLTYWVYPLNRDLAHAETVLLLVYFMYILLNNSVALTFAVNPKSLGGRVQPISIEVLSLPLSSNHHEVFFFLPSVSCFRIAFTGPKKFPKLSPLYPSLPSLSSCKTAFFFCIWGEFWKLYVWYTDRTDLQVGWLRLDGGKGGIGMWQE